MKEYIMHFPGDPPVLVQEMSFIEFLIHHPREDTVISSLDRDFRPTEISRNAVPPKLVICDTCNARIKEGQKVFVYNGIRGVCEACANENWLPHCTLRSKLQKLL